MQRPVQALAVKVAAGCIFLAMADDDYGKIVFRFPILTDAVTGGGQQEK
jgi:hypothetical protein